MLSNYWDRNRDLILPVGAVAAVLLLMITVYVSWRTEPGTVTTLSWACSIEVQERCVDHDGDHYWRTVASNYTTGLYPEPPRWPTIRPLRTGWFAPTERYVHTANLQVAAKSDLGRCYTRWADAEEYAALKPGMRVMITAYFRGCVYAVVPLVCEE